MPDVKTQLRVLLVEDSADDAALVLRELRKSGYEPLSERVETAPAMREALDGQSWDIILSDYLVPGFGGIDALQIAKESGLDLPFVLVSGKVGEEIAVQVMKAGAADFVMKDRLGRLGSVVKRELADATARKQAKEALRESENKFQQLGASAQDAIIVVNQDGRITDWNAAAERAFGYGAGEVIGQDMHALIAPARERDAIQIGLQQFRKSGTGAVINKTLETVALRRDGTEFPAELSISSAMLGGQWHAIGIVRDITDRKRLEEQREQYFKFFMLSIDPMCIADPFGCFRQVNPAFVKLTGYSEAELVSKPFLDFVLPEDRQRTTQEMELQVKERASLNFENRYVCKDGSVIHLSWTAFFDRGNGITYATARDVTEKKRGELALQHADRTLQALSDCNQALIHASDETQLLNEICRVIVSVGGYRLAYVGYAEHDTQKTVRPVAHFGYDEGYLTASRISWADTALGHGPTGTAIRTGVVQVNQNFRSEPTLTPWREAALAHGYQSSIALPLRNSAEILGVLTVYAVEPDAFNAVEIKLLQELADDLAFGIVTLRSRSTQERTAERLQRSMEATVQAVASTVEMRDPYTAGHQRRVAELARAIAGDLGLTPDEVHGIYLAGVVHDLGKVHIPAEILSMPRKLSAIEFEFIRTHPQAAYDILKDVDFPWPIAQMVFQHHERIDGSGYPRGLKGDEILLGARILMVADVVEAMASHRPYRPARGVELALQEISANAGKYYDADVVRSCTSLFRDKGFAFTT